MSEELGFINMETWHEIGQEYQRAVRLHGPRFETLLDAEYALRNEFIEVIKALDKNDIDGEHGVKRELTQVIAVCIKILEGLRDEK